MCRGQWLHLSTFLPPLGMAWQRSGHRQSGPLMAGESRAPLDHEDTVRRILSERTEIFMEINPDMTLLGTVMP